MNKLNLRLDVVRPSVCPWTPALTRPTTRSIDATWWAAHLTQVCWSRETFEGHRVWRTIGHRVHRTTGGPEQKQRICSASAWNQFDHVLITCRKLLQSDVFSVLDDCVFACAITCLCRNMCQPWPLTLPLFFLGICVSGSAAFSNLLRRSSSLSSRTEKTKQLCYRDGKIKRVCAETEEHTPAYVMFTRVGADELWPDEQIVCRQMEEIVIWFLLLGLNSSDVYESVCIYRCNVRLNISLIQKNKCLNKYLLPHIHSPHFHFQCKSFQHTSSRDPVVFIWTLQVSLCRETTTATTEEGLNYLKSGCGNVKSLFPVDSKLDSDPFLNISGLKEN